ncbi:MAG: hypothetical protein GY784_15505 [Gammaproteobacteria bacterium]|nr:hypothetical protein [Gammaproteobacteria bacterium]
MQKVLLPFLLTTLLTCTQIWAAEESEKEAGTEGKSSSYISLGKPMVLNLSSHASRLTFLQLSANVLIDDSDAEDLVKVHIPAIRHELIVLLSEQNAVDMKSPDKREEIRKLATAQVQERVAELTGRQSINDVLFSTFLVQ